MGQKFSMGAPRRQRQSVERYNIIDASLRALAKRYGINPKTVAKWKKARIGHRPSDRP